MRRSLTSLALLLALCLTGCTESIDRPVSAPESIPDTVISTAKKVPFTLSYYAGSSLHPVTGSSRSTQVIAGLVYEGLFALDNSFTPHKVLCKDFSISEDGLIWSFTLNDTVFSDGSPVTASDVVSSLELARNSTLYASRLANIQNIRAGEDGTVLISLSQPNSNLPALLDTPVFHDSEDGSMPVGSGPYHFAEDDGPLRLVLHDDTLTFAPDEIPLTAIENADDLIHAFDAGNISLVVSDMTGANALGFSSGYEEFRYPTTTMLYVGFQAKEGPCKNAAVRRILSRSFDRNTITNSLLAGHGDATCLPFSPRSAVYSYEHEQAGEFVSNAVDTLSQIGYGQNEEGLWYGRYTPLTLTFVVNTDNSFKLRIAEYLTEQLISQGISVDLQKLTWDEYLSALEQGKFDLYLGEVSLTADFDLSSLLAKDGALNYGGYNNDKTETLLTQLRAANTNQQSQIASAVLDQFQAEAPFAPLCFKSHSVLTQWRCVSGLTPTRQNPFYHVESLRFDAVE